MLARTSSEVHRIRPIGIGVAALLLLGLTLFGPPARAATGSHAWGMDESPGTGTMFDSGSPATDGDWRNIQAGVPGSSGTAYRFDGTSRVTVADAASLDPGTDTFTVSAKVKFTTMPTNANGGDFDLVRKGLGSTSGGYWKIEAYPNSAHTKVNGLCQMKGSANHIKITGAPVSLNNNQWHTITCTKTSSNVTLTVDGTSYRKTVTIGSISNGDPLTVGADRMGDDAYIGDMDEVSYTIGSGSPPPPPPGGISEVQTKKASASATSISATFGSAPKSGDLLVAAVVVPASASPGFDTPAGWTRAFTPARGAVFWKVSNGSENTVTVNLSSGEAARPLRMWFVELSGANTSNPFDQGGSAVVGSSTSSMTAATGGLSQADEWAIAIAAQNGDNGGGAAASNGFDVLGTSDSRSIAATKILSSTNAVSTAISWTTPRAGSWLIATFRAA